MARPQPTQTERLFDEGDIIVSKTDTKGRITYANDVFCDIGLYTEDELIGQPHAILRHPDMPRCVFHLLWERIEAGREVFAFVKNMAKNGDYYWVLAHVTPSFDKAGKIDGYHSNRRVPERRAVEAIARLYRELLAEEGRQADRRAAIAAGRAMLEARLEALGQSYDEFIFSLT